MSRASVVQSSGQSLKPNCCRRLNFDDPKTTGNHETYSENENVNDIRITDSIRDILMRDVREKSDYYNFDFINDHPLPPPDDPNVGFEWTYVPSSCQYYFREPHKKGDSLIPVPPCDTRSTYPDSPLTRVGSSVDDLKTPGKNHPKKNETNGVTNASVMETEESEK